jgi:hypothetical protein
VCCLEGGDFVVSQEAQINGDPRPALRRGERQAGPAPKPPRLEVGV